MASSKKWFIVCPCKPCYKHPGQETLRLSPTIHDDDGVATYAQQVVTSVGKQLDKLDSLLAKSEAKEKAMAEEEKHVLRAADALLSTARPLANATQVLHDGSLGVANMEKTDKENINPNRDSQAIADTQIDPASEDAVISDDDHHGDQFSAETTQDAAGGRSKTMNIEKYKKLGLDAQAPKVKKTIGKNKNPNGSTSQSVKEKLETKSKAKSEKSRGVKDMPVEETVDIAKVPKNLKITKGGPDAKKEDKDDSEGAIPNTTTIPAESSGAKKPKAKSKASPKAKICKPESKKGATKAKQTKTKSKKSAEPKAKSKRKVRDLKTDDDVAAKMHSASWPAICLWIYLSFPFAILSYALYGCASIHVHTSFSIIITTEVYSTAWNKARTMGKNGADRKKYAQDARKTRLALNLTYMMLWYVLHDCKPFCATPRSVCLF